MLSISFYDQIDEIPNTLNRVILHTTTVSYYYHSVNVISLSLAQSNHIKRLTLYLQFLSKEYDCQTNLCCCISQVKFLFQIVIINECFQTQIILQRNFKAFDVVEKNKIVKTPNNQVLISVQHFDKTFLFPQKYK